MKKQLTQLTNLQDLIKSIDLNQFRPTAIGSYDLEKIINKQLFAEYIISTVCWGPCSFNKKLRGDKTIREIAPDITHGQFNNICSSVEEFIREKLNLKYSYPTNKDEMVELKAKKLRIDELTKSFSKSSE